MSKALADGYELRDARPEEAEDLLPLMKLYCSFYEVEPNDPGLLEMARTLATDQEQGSIFIARRTEGGQAVGFATLAWKWSSLRGARVGVMEDLFVDPGARGSGLADALIAACGKRCLERGYRELSWFTATDNFRAQKVYNRVGGKPGELIEFELDLGGSSTDSSADATGA